MLLLYAVGIEVKNMANDVLHIFSIGVFMALFALAKSFRGCFALTRYQKEKKIIFPKALSLFSKLFRVL